MIIRQTEPPEISAVKKPPRRSLARTAAITGWIFVLPWVIGFFLWKLSPILTALAFSFTDFHMLTPEQTRFIGLTNYVRILQDQRAGSSLFRSLGTFLFTVPVQMAVALALAAIFSSNRLHNKLVLRTLFFMPSIIPAVAISLVISGLVDPRTGWITRLILQPLHLSASNLSSLFPLVLMLWSIGPGFIIMLGAIQGVSKELYEAARVDGAGPIMRFTSITLPMISPAIFFTLIINMTNAFGGVVLLDRALPYNRSLSAMEGYINFQMFSRFDLGYATALAWMMFVVVMVIALVIFRSAKYWVYFPEEGANEEF